MDNYFIIKKRLSGSGSMDSPVFPVYELAFKWAFDSLPKAREEVLNHGTPEVQYIITALNSRVRLKVTKELVG